MNVNLNEQELTEEERGYINKLSDIEKLLLPVTLDTNFRLARQMVYKAIKKYNDQPVAGANSIKTLVSRYYHRPEVMAYLSIVEKTRNNESFEEELDIEEEDISKKGVINNLVKEANRPTTSPKLRVEINKAIATINGYTREQKTKASQKMIYVPLTCYECNLYKEAQHQLETNKKEQNDNS